MATCLALIPRDEIKEDCVTTGRRIEDAVVTKKRRLSDEELEEIVEPLVDGIVERTKKATEKEAEEERARIADRRAEDDREDEWVSIQAMVSENRRVRVFQETDSGDEEELLEETMELREQRAEEGGIVTSISEQFAEECIEKWDVNNFHENGDDWDDYYDQVHITIKAPYARFYNIDDRSIVPLAMEVADGDPKRFIEVLEKVQKAKLLKHDWTLPPIIAGAKAIYEMYQ